MFTSLSISSHKDTDLYLYKGSGQVKLSRMFNTVRSTLLVGITSPRTKDLWLKIFFFKSKEPL